MLRTFGNLVGSTVGFFKNVVAPPRMQLIDTPFDYQSSTHLEIIGNRLERFKQAQSALYNFDNKILSSLGVGLIFWTGSSIIPFLPSTSLSIAGFSYASYLIGRRADSSVVVKPYRDALADLIEVYKWSMSNKTNTWWKLGVPQIQDMIVNLGPVVKSETIAMWDEKDLLPGKLYTRAREPSEELKQKMGEFAAGIQTKNIWFSVYGETGNDDLLGRATTYFKELSHSAIEKYAPVLITGSLKMQ